GSTALSGIRHPIDSTRCIRAVLFDLDGTLYGQTSMRLLMACELLMLAFINPFLAPRRWRGLQEYRRAQEALRQTHRGRGAAANQLDTAAERAGMSRTSLEQLVDEWMFKRPLKYMRFCRVSGLIELLDFLERNGLPVG